MAPQSTELMIRPEEQSFVIDLAKNLGVDAPTMIQTFKKTILGREADRTTNAELVVFLHVCKELDLNPMIPGHIYAYPKKDGGVVPMIGPDGITKLLRQDKDVLSYETDLLRDKEGSIQLDADGVPFGATAKIHLRSAPGFPITMTVFTHEWRTHYWSKEGKKVLSPKWERPAHAIQQTALKQAARRILSGIPMDHDELVAQDAREVVEVEAIEAKPTTPSGLAAALAARKATAPAAAPQPEKTFDAEFTEEAVEPPPSEVRKPPKEEHPPQVIAAQIDALAAAMHSRRPDTSHGQFVGYFFSVPEDLRKDDARAVEYAKEADTPSIQEALKVAIACREDDLAEELDEAAMEMATRTNRPSSEFTREWCKLRKDSKAARAADLLTFRTKDQKIHATYVSKIEDGLILARKALAEKENA